LGIGDWGLGIGDWAQSPIPNPQSPIPNPQSPFKYLNDLFLENKEIIINNIYKKYIFKNYMNESKSKSKNKNKKDLLEGKLILLGDSGVGKTKLINVANGKDFLDTSNVTISASFLEKIFEIDSIKYKIFFWDTAGSEKYRGLTKLYYKGSDIVIFVYDITSNKSFDSLKEWINEAKGIIENNYVCGIVGNKKDLYKVQEIPDKEGIEFAKEKGMKFKLVSAKEDKDSFIEFVKELIKDARENLEKKREALLLLKKKNKKHKCNC